jgi:hypothetical protein
MAAVFHRLPNHPAPHPRVLSSDGPAVAYAHWGTDPLLRDVATPSLSQRLLVVPCDQYGNQVACEEACTGRDQGLDRLKLIIQIPPVVASVWLAVYE